MAAMGAVLEEHPMTAAAAIAASGYVTLFIRRSSTVLGIGRRRRATDSYPTAVESCKRVGARGQPPPKRAVPTPAKAACRDAVAMQTRVMPSPRPVDGMLAPGARPYRPKNRRDGFRFDALVESVQPVACLFNEFRRRLVEQPRLVALGYISRNAS